MALKRNERYPGRFSNPTTQHPQGAFKNRSAPGAQDGSYLESDWVNDWSGFFEKLLTVGAITPNGNVDTALASQYYDALVKLTLQRSNPFADIKSDGTVQTALANLGFEQSVAATGYQVLPGGLIFQWGTATGDQGNLGAAYPMAFKERVFQVLLTLNDKTAGAVDGVSLYATRDNFTNKTTLIVQNKGKDLLGVTTASYFAIGK